MSIFTNPKFKILTTSGGLAVGYKIYFFETGTSTPKNTYPTSADAAALTNANANPAITNSNGEVEIWPTTGQYRIRIDSDADITQTGYPVDGIEGAGITLGAGEDIIGSSTSDILWNTNKFIVLGASGNTTVGGTFTADSTVNIADDIQLANAKSATWRNVGNTAYVDVMTLDSSDNTVIDSGVGATTILKSAGTIAATIDASQNVGVGHATPGARVEIVLNDGTPPTYTTGTIGILRSNSNTTDNAFLQITSGTAGNSGINLGDSANDNVGFLDYDNNVNELAVATNGTIAMTIDNTQQVGFGIGAADGTVHIHSGTAGVMTSNAAANELTLENNGPCGMSIINPDADIGAIYFGTVGSGNAAAKMLYDYGVSGANNIVKLGTNITSGQISFMTDDEVEAIRIDASQQVGFGIAAPDGKVHIWSGNAGSMTSNTAANELTVENAGPCGISILNPAADIGAIYFGTDESGNSSAKLSYDYGTSGANNIMRIGTNIVSGVLSLMSGDEVECINIDGSQDINLLSDTVLYKRTDANRGAAGTAGRLIFNTDDGKLNVDDGTNWTLPDGTTT